MDNTSKKNFGIINNIMIEQNKVINQLLERVSMLEGNASRLQEEIANTKQLAAHLHGRGMGSTVHEHND